MITEGAPVGTGRLVVVLIHGRNATAKNILTLVPRLDRPGLTYVAPAAANNTWYPFSFLTDIPKNEPDLSSALAALQALVADLETRGVERRRIVLMGFSQGACLSAEFAVRQGGRWGGVVALSGGLIGPPGTTWPQTRSLEGTPVFFGCSDVDAHIPRERVEESAAVFQRLGADVTTHLYPGMGHVVNDDEIQRAQAILDRAASGDDSA